MVLFPGERGGGGESVKVLLKPLNSLLVESCFEIKVLFTVTLLLNDFLSAFLSEILQYFHDEKIC